MPSGLKPPWDTDSYSSALLDANDKIETLQQQIIYWTEFANKEIEKAEKENERLVKGIKALMSTTDSATFGYLQKLIGE